jgi:hypothetical protein
MQRAGLVDVGRTTWKDATTTNCLAGTTVVTHFAQSHQHGPPSQSPAIHGRQSAVQHDSWRWQATLNKQRKRTNKQREVRRLCACTTQSRNAILVIRISQQLTGRAIRLLPVAYALSARLIHILSHSHRPAGLHLPALTYHLHSTHRASWLQRNRPTPKSLLSSARSRCALLSPTRKRSSKTC